MCSVLHRVANSSWFTQNFPGFSTISWENPQSLTNQDGWSSYCYKKNDVCYVKKKTGDTIINAEVLNAKFVCSNTSQFLLIGKKKKKTENHTCLSLPSPFPFTLPKQLGKEFSSSGTVEMSARDWLLKWWPPSPNKLLHPASAGQEMSSFVPYVGHI